MKRTIEKKILLFTTLCLWLAAYGVFGQLNESPPAWTYGAEFDLNSRYVWRSLAWSEGAVWQPSVWVGISGWTFSVWSNFVLHNEPNYHQFNEFDYRISYKKEFGHLKVEPAFSIYSYPNKDRIENPATAELELLASYDLGPLTLVTTHAFDVWDNRGGYIGEVGVEIEREPIASLTVIAAARLTFASARFNGYYVPLEKTAVNAFVLELGLTYDISNAVYIRPHVEWSQILDRDLKTALKTSTYLSVGKASLFNIGIAIGLAY